MAKPKPGRGSDQFPLRLPPGMRDMIKVSAKESGRSMNQEIIEALREIFPEAPTIEELIGEVDHAASLLEELSETEVKDIDFLFGIIGRLEDTSDNLKHKLPPEHHVRSVRLDADVSERVAKFMKSWELGTVRMHEDVVNNLVRMSLTRIENREESFKVVIGEGEARRVVEIIPPWEQNPDKPKSSGE